MASGGSAWNADSRVSGSWRSAGARQSREPSSPRTGKGGGRRDRQLGAHPERDGTLVGSRGPRIRESPAWRSSRGRHVCPTSRPTASAGRTHQATAGVRDHTSPQRGACCTGAVIEDAASGTRRRSGGGAGVCAACAARPGAGPGGWRVEGKGLLAAPRAPPGPRVL
jgi:hypothetical protein